jgi:TusA-related sulfurtransferase
MEVNTFYIKKGEREYSKVNFKKNDIIEALKLSKSATESVEKFCKTNNIKSKLTEEQASKMLTYIDALLEN